MANSISARCDHSHSGALEGPVRCNLGRAHMLDKLAEKMVEIILTE